MLELAACEVPEIDKSTVTVSSELTWASTLSLTLDGVVSNNVFSNPNGQNIANKTYLKFEFTEPTILTDIELACVAQGLVTVGSKWQVEASNDDINWTDLSGELTTSGPQTGAISGAVNAENLPFSNSSAYTFYRIYSISGTTINWYLTEVYD